MNRCLSLFVSFCAALLFAAWPIAAAARDGGGEVRVSTACGNGSTAQLRLRSRDDGIELRFAVDDSRSGRVWRIAIVHERRIAWRGTAKTTRASDSFELRRTLPDLPGADSVTATAWGPRGTVCRVSATLSSTSTR
jgi:hypothetical protein